MNFKSKLKNKKACPNCYAKRCRRAFTLIELLVVIAIIGILSGVVLVSSRTGVDKAKRASALTTVSSALTELATCSDDGGEVKSGGLPVVGTQICCTTNTCATSMAGHTAKWPDITSVGWAYKTTGTPGDLDNGDYKFTIEKTGETDIVCDFANSNCT